MELNDVDYLEAEKFLLRIRTGRALPKEKSRWLVWISIVIVVGIATPFGTLFSLYDQGLGKIDAANLVAPIPAGAALGEALRQSLEQELLDCLAIFATISLAFVGMGQILQTLVHSSLSRYVRQVDGTAKMLTLFGWCLGLASATFAIINDTNVPHWAVYLPMVVVVLAVGVHWIPPFFAFVGKSRNAKK